MKKLFSLFGKELLNVEFKEFSLKIDIEKYYTQDEIYKIIETGKIDKKFNKTIMKNIKYYIKSYLPKYVSAFGNMKGDNIISKLYFGIDDYSEITGIPFLGELPIGVIKDYVKKYLKKYIIAKKEIKEKIIEDIKITFHRLEIDDSLMYSNLKEIVDKKQLKYKETLMKKDKYIQEWNEWFKELSKYSIKLKEIICNEDTLKELENYILEHDPSKIYLLKEKFDIDNLIENIRDTKNHKDNIMYWICNFRDYNMNKITEKKPKKPKLNLKEINFTKEFIKLNDFRKILIENNKNLNYYVIEIVIPSCLNKNEEDNIYYIDSSKFQVIKKKVRICDKHNEPICI